MAALVGVGLKVGLEGVGLCWMFNWWLDGARLVDVGCSLKGK